MVHLGGESLNHLLDELAAWDDQLKRCAGFENDADDALDIESPTP